MKFFRYSKRYPRKSSRKYASKPTVKKAIRQVRAKAFRKKVLSVVASQAETKLAWHVQPTTDFNSGISGSGDCLRIIPNIARGTADNERIGDQLVAKSINIRGVLQMLPQALGQNDGVRKIACRVMIVTPKGYTNWATASANTSSWMPLLLKKGGTTNSFTGAIDDLFAPANTDAITVHYNKVFYFNQNTYGQSTASGYVAFDQSHLVRFLNIKIKCRNKVVKYDTGVDAGLTPTNLGYFMVVGYSFVDGTSPDVVSTRIRLQYESIFKYEDA